MPDRRLAALVAAATLVLGGFAVLATLPQADAATTRVVAITNASAHPKVPFKTFDTTLKLFDLNGDGRKEIIGQNDNQWIYVFDSKTGALLSQVTTTFPSGWTARTMNSPEASVMRSGGPAKIVVANSAAVVTSFRVDAAASSATNIVLVKEWDRRLSDCYSNPGSDAKIVLADLDRDGSLEILASTEESGIYALRADGSLYWKACIGGGNGEPVVADLNQDGRLEVVFGSDGGVIAALNGQTGGWVWGLNLKAHFNLGSGSIPVGVGIGQLDGVGGPDIVAGARDSHNPDDWSQDHALLVAVSSSGKILWGRQDPKGNPLTYTRPVVVDADRNGVNEVYWGDWNTIGHKPPWDSSQAWKVTGPANFYRYDNRGGLVWKTSLPTFWSNKDVPLADVDGDGVQEMLANGPAGNGHDGIWYLDSRNGAKETFVDVYPWKVARAPTIGDFWGTGTMQWAVPVGVYDASAGSPGILVYDTHVRYSSAWPHPPGPVTSSGTPIPPPPTSTTTTTTTTTTSSPPPGGTFDATFTIKAPNAWWQELYVSAPGHTITAAQLRINGGSWMPMAKSSWGAWTASKYAPAGSKVEFLVTDSGGAKSQSLPFTWLDGTTTRGSTTPSDSGSGFSASFRLSPNVNNWWVEVSVQPSGGTLARVDAQVNGGSWVSLSKTSWGTWAKSFFVPDGAKVVFRATSNSGETAFSSAYTWA